MTVVAAHPGLAITAAACVIAVVVLAVTWACLPHSPRPRKASRPAHRAPSKTWGCEQRARAGRAPRARRRVIGTVRRWPGTIRTWWAFTRRRFERQPTTEEREFMGLLRQAKEDAGGPLALPAYDTTVQIPAVDVRAAKRTIIHHDMGPGAGFPSSLPVTTATCEGAIDPPKVDSPAPADTPSAAGERDVSPTGSPSVAMEAQPGAASLESGPESEPQPATVPAPADLTPTDAERWPHLAVSPWLDDTGTFTRLTGVA